MLSILQKTVFAFIIASLSMSFSFAQTCNDVTPTVSATGMTFTSVDTTSLTVNWTKGGGRKRIVIAREATAVSVSPTNGSQYTANSVFGQGAQLSSGQFVVYNDTGSTVHITGLKVWIVYHFKVVEYDGCASTLYQTGGLIGNRRTLRIPQSITFNTIPAQFVDNAPFMVTATASSGLPVSFAITNGGTIASISGNTITLSGTTGTVTVQATQTGNNTYAPAPAVTKSFTVSKRNQTITIQTIEDKTTADTSFTIFGSASSGLQVTYSLVSGPAIVSGSTITLTGDTGTVSIKASQAGNTIYKAATDVTTSFKVKSNPFSQTISFTPIANKFVDDSPFRVLAYASSGLPVTLTIVSGPASVSNDTIVLSGTVGTVIITASQAGNGIYPPAQSVTDTFTVSKRTQTISLPLVNKKVNDAPFRIFPVASSGLPVTISITKGPATLSGDTIILSGLTGTVTVKVTQAGNSVYNSTFISKSFTVGKSSQTITFDAVPKKYVNSVPFTISATTTSGLPLTYIIMSGPATISNGQITLTGVYGNVVVRAQQAGNEFYNSAVLDYTFLVNKIAQTITFPAIPNKLTTSLPFNVSATSSSGLAITYSIVSGPATISGNTVTLTGGTGTVTVKAYQGGNAVYSARSLNVSFTVSSPSRKGLLVDDNAATEVLSAYPNPTTGEVKLIWNQAETINSIKVMDTKGNELINLTSPIFADQYNLDLSGLAKGMYIVQIISNDTVRTETIIKE